MIRRVFVLYDAECGFCCACARWLATQPHLVEVVALARNDPRIRELFPGLPPAIRPDIKVPDLTVVDDQGGVYLGDSAWLVAMWALAEWRPWSHRFATPTLRPLAREAFALISSGRHGINALFGLKGDDQIAAAMRRITPESGAPCGEGGCAV